MNAVGVSEPIPTKAALPAHLRRDVGACRVQGVVGTEVGCEPATILGDVYAHNARADRDFAWIHLTFLAAVATMPFSTSLLAAFITFALPWCSTGPTSCSWRGGATQVGGVS
jgi:hypothetical protein